MTLQERSPGAATPAAAPATARAGTPAPRRARLGAAVDVEGLTWRPYGRRTPVLDAVDLRVAPGERVLLAGPSGSGKSTLLRGIAGLLLAADSGEVGGRVRVGGRDPQETPGDVGLVLQDPGSGVVASTTGRDVAFGLENVRVPRAAMAARVSDVLAEVGLTQPPDTSPGSLSGGEQQRLALAGALALGPRVLLLDEPTAMLDAATAATVRRVVDEVARERGLTLVVVEHRLDGWVDLVDRLVVLGSAGDVVADGPVRTVLADRADELTAQGIWVPGAPEPQPLRLELPPVPGGAAGAAPRAAAAAGAAVSEPVVARADRVTVVHHDRRLGAPDRTVLAVADADLEVPAGRTVALVGPSGAGKSTLLTTLGGLTEPTSGTVRIAEPTTPEAAGADDEAPYAWPSERLARVVAWVPQRAATTIAGATVREDVLTTPRALGLADEAAARVDTLLRALGLEHLRDADPHHLSGGEQRRLALAAAVAHAPSLVLADEPTVGQDRHTWAAVAGVLEAARAEGSGVVVTTHDPGIVARADRVLALEPPAAAGPGADDAGPVRTPLVGRAGPLALLVVALSVLPLPALLDSWRQGLVVLAVEAALAALLLVAPGPGRRPSGRVRGVLARLAPAALAAVGVAWSSWLLGGRDLEIAAGAALRVLALVVPSAVVVGFIDPERLGDHLAQRLRLPARPVVAATAALHRVQSLDTLWRELMRSRRARGIRADRGLVRRLRETAAVTLGLLVGALGQAATLALAMDARGFTHARVRTWAGAAPWRLPDTLAVAIGLLPVVAAVLARFAWPA